MCDLQTSVETESRSQVRQRLGGVGSGHVGKVIEEELRTVRIRRDMTGIGAPCVLASLEEVLVAPTPTPKGAPGQMCAGCN